MVRTVKSLFFEAEISKLIIYDDGSSCPINLDFDCPFDIQIIRAECNNGIGYSLNYLLKEATSQNFEFAALIDAGDLVVPGRTSLQAHAFSLNQSAVVIGGGMEIVNMDNITIGRFDPPVGKSAIARAFRRGYPFAHPTAMFKLSKLMSLNIFYNTRMKAAVDFNFLYRIHISNENYIFNIPDLLVKYVREANSIGIKRASAQAREALITRARYANISNFNSVAGLFDMRLIIRSVSPRLFFALSRTFRAVRKSQHNL